VALLAKVALDDIHPGRCRVSEYLIANPGAHATAAIAVHCRLPPTTTRRHLQDLMAHGVVDFMGDHPERWAASAWLRNTLWAVDRFDPPERDEAILLRFWFRGGRRTELGKTGSLG
jgi:IclR helix-turn-helix domain